MIDTRDVVVLVVGIIMLIVAPPVVSYNRFVSQRNLIKDSWSNIDTELRRRYDLIPNLVETVKGYAAHEKAVFEEITRARARAADMHGAPADQARAESGLSTSLRRLFAVAEGYPDLKASDQFLRLQHELVITEDRIQTARRFYNANVRDYNRRVKSIPSNIIASMFSFTEAQFFELDPAIRDAPAPQADVAPAPRRSPGA